MYIGIFISNKNIYYSFFKNKKYYSKIKNIQNKYEARKILNIKK